MNTPMIAGTIDIAELSFYLFFLFFIGLVIYLRREDRREGYPLETDVGGTLLYNEGLLQRAQPKHFILPFDKGIAEPNTTGRDPLDIPGTRRTSSYSGSPLEPTGNPIGGGFGPGSAARRSDDVDVTSMGLPRIVPIGVVSGLTTSNRDPNPRGMPVIGCDGATAGTVTDLWVDQSEMMLRYLEVDTGTGKTLMPMTMALIDKRRGVVKCSALTAAQFVGAPYPAVAGQVTSNEEEQIVAYFGSGYLYATADRQEPYL